MSLDVLLGYTGLPSLGQAAYFGVAAYAVALLATERQVGLLGCAAAGIALAAVTAAVFGVVAIRATRRLLPDDHARPRHGGLGARLPVGVADQGRQRRLGRAATRAGRLGLTAPLPVLYSRSLTAASAWALLGARRVSPFGLGLKGIRGSESRMEALGYNVWLHKYVAFVHCRHLRGRGRRALGLLQRLRRPHGRAARDLRRGAPDDGARRPGHPDRARHRRRRSSCSSRTS